MVAIPEAFHDLFERKTFAHLATVMPDGAPHVAPVWIDYMVEGERLLVNTERGRQKVVNVQHDPRVGLSMTDPEDPYRRLSVVGEVVEMTTEGAREHIDVLSRRYTGHDYDNEIRTERLLLVIKPERTF